MKTKLLFDLKVSKILPKPQNALVNLALFRVTAEGNGATDQSVSIANGSTINLAAMSCLVIRTDRLLTVTITDTQGTKVLQCKDIMLLSQNILSAAVSYTDALSPLTDAATVSIIFT